MSRHEVFERIQGYNFLIADDVSNMRTVIKRMLRHIGFKNHLEAANGEKAFDLLRSRRVDFILADWRMPVVSGIDLLRMVRSEPRFHHIPFVVITGEVEEKRIIQAAEGEIDGYIIKPFFTKILEDKIYSVIERKESPQKFDIHIKKAQGFLEVPQFENALEECKAAIALKPQSARAHTMLGNIHLKMGNVELGEHEIEEAIKLNSMYIRAHEDLAEHYAEKGDQLKALKYFEGASDISPHNVKRQLATGKIYLDVGRADKAKKAFEMARKEVRKNDTSIISQIAEAYLAKGFDAEAIEAFQINLKMDGHDINAYNKLGIALRRMGRFEESIKEYEKAMLVDPDDEVIHFNIARAFNEYGEWNKALLHIERSITLSPNFTEAIEYRKALIGE